MGPGILSEVVNALPGPQPPSFPHSVISMKPGYHLTKPGAERVAIAHRPQDGFPFPFSLSVGGAGSPCDSQWPCPSCPLTVIPSVATCAVDGR